MVKPPRDPVSVAVRPNQTRSTRIDVKARRVTITQAYEHDRQRADAMTVEVIPIVLIEQLGRRDAIRFDGGGRQLRNLLNVERLTRRPRQADDTSSPGSERGDVEGFAVARHQ